MKENIFFRFSFLVLVSSLFLNSCTHKLQVTPKIHIEELAICMEFEKEVSEKVHFKIDSVLSNFIDRYNKNQHSFRLTECNNADSMSLRLMVGKTELISPSQQTAATVITALGILTPFILNANGSNFYITFFYIPFNKTRIKVDLSPEINSSMKSSIKRKISSFSLYGNLGTQLKRQLNALDDFFEDLLEEVEQSYIKQENPKKRRRRY